MKEDTLCEQELDQMQTFIHLLKQFAMPSLGIAEFSWLSWRSGSIRFGKTTPKCRVPTGQFQRFRLILILGAARGHRSLIFDPFSGCEPTPGCGIRGSLLSTSRPFSGRRVIKFFRVARSFDRSLKRRN